MIREPTQTYCWVSEEESNMTNETNYYNRPATIPFDYDFESQLNNYNNI